MGSITLSDHLGGCYNAYPKLLLVIPNEIPVLVDTPNNQEICLGESGTIAFEIMDQDNDSLHFNITVSNESIIDYQNLIINQDENTYTLSFFANMPGSSSVTVVANDGYGGSVGFSFTIEVNNLPDSVIMQIDGDLIANESNAIYQWLDCNNNHAPIPGESEQIFTPTNSGSYAAGITNSFGCTTISDCISIIITEVKNQSGIETILISPYPTINELVINTSSHIDKIEVYTLLGHKLMTKTELDGNMLDISSLSVGTYIIKITKDQHVVTSRFVKN